ncbi:hypothetical protein K474DRAFT_333382 [Panus rudis PR-1116 ss-1]|nr:hypothetical protein K474DRAFT_333382 [Panus rudis PR-1116 ss-1]
MLLIWSMARRPTRSNNNEACCGISGRGPRVRVGEGLMHDELMVMSKAIHYAFNARDVLAYLITIVVLFPYFSYSRTCEYTDVTFNLNKSTLKFPPVTVTVTGRAHGHGRDARKQRSAETRLETRVVWRCLYTGG